MITLLTMFRTILYSEPEIITNTKNLLNDATSWILGISTTVTVVAALYFIVRMQTSEEDEIPKYRKRLKGVLILGIVAVSISGIFKFILSYYQG